MCSRNCILCIDLIMWGSIQTQGPRSFDNLHVYKLQQIPFHCLLPVYKMWCSSVCLSIYPPSPLLFGMYNSSNLPLGLEKKKKYSPLTVSSSDSSYKIFPNVCFCFFTPPLTYQQKTKIKFTLFSFKCRLVKQLNCYHSKSLGAVKFVFLS